jgi:hypothetical protein
MRSHCFKVGAASTAVLGALLLGACQGHINVGGGGGGGIGGEGGTEAGQGGGGGLVACSGGQGDGGGPQQKADKIDLLLVVGNARGMADKQAILAAAVPDLLKGLLNPPCLDGSGAPVAMQPASPLDACPAGSARAFQPVLDMHIGVLSASLGGHGSDSCPDADPNSPECAPNPNYTNNDKAHLLSRLDACGGGDVPTYQNQGFLAWDPQKKLTPNGESVLDDGAGHGLVADLRHMILGVGEIGCQYQAPLESWYRFLVDPAPYDSISVVNGVATPQGVDGVILQQRAQFLRPDSMLVILTLDDGDDCSIRDGSNFYQVAQQNVPGQQTAFRMPRARQECSSNPNHPCCRSCAQPQGDCPADPTCIAIGGPEGAIATLSETEDPLALRCWDQKRRFGIDALYPVERYSQALTCGTIEDREGQPAQNPLFTGSRDPGLVVVSSLAGVPWQDIARDPSNLALGFKTAAELSQSGTWDTIVGKPATWTPPTDPRMSEAINPRVGIPAGDPINGGDRTIPGGDDLQYACIFPLPTGAERDCNSGPFPSCVCEPGNDNPICGPNASGERTSQRAAPAYPGIRELRVLQGVGAQGVTASVCPAQLTNLADTAKDFGYRPAVKALIDRIAQRL